LQARRQGDRVRNEEHAAFADRLGVENSQVQQVDILEDNLTIDILKDCDAVLVGGAGEFGVVDPIEPVAQMIKFLVAATERTHPIFASCFGFQALVSGLGGEVIEDEDRAEVGTYMLKTTEFASANPVFGGLPQNFKAQLGHKDRAVRLPECVSPMASSELCPYQAFSIPGTPVYATQFHPELTWKDNRLRFERYMEHYGRLFGQEEAQRKLDGHVPSPEANELLDRFVSRILLGNAS
ncbi:MAG: glutamine amidotransferase-related protein, partial [Myxococcota bacterium]